MHSSVVQNLRSKQTWGIAFGSAATASHATFPSDELKFEKLSFEISPLQVFSGLHGRYKDVYLLESIEGPRKLAQYSFIGFDPKLTVTIKNGEATSVDEESGEKNREKITDPLYAIKKIIQNHTVQERGFRFVGGAVGYFSYDAVRYWEKLPQKAKSDLDFPDAEFGVFDDGIIFDHTSKNALYYYTSHNRLAEIESSISQPDEPTALFYSQPKANVTKEQFMQAVKEAKDYVVKGDIFQVVLSKRFEFEVRGDLIAFYHALRRINPSPYMYFLKMGDRQIVGSSPEMLVRVENRVAETFPIAGTRPCVKKQEENRRLSNELLADPKERAEHVMLVDLARNDLGKVSKFGSVRVTEFMKVHQYSHVQHIVSRVEGKLNEDSESFDALSAVFPAGTVSGAPKVRAMEIIEELEPTRRGPYAGAVGYFSFNGNADFAITIRTLFANKNKAYIQTGAGIVADSVPEKEWMETEHKAEALMKALAASGGEKP